MKNIRNYLIQTKRFIQIATLFCFSFTALPVRSTIVVEMDVKTLAQNSCAVVVGELLEIQKEWVPSPVAGGDPVVQAILRVEIKKVFKSCSGIKEGDVIPVLRPGGSIGDSGTIVVGAPTFKSGTRLLLFLAQTPQGQYIITGLSQGKFRLLKNSKTGQEEAVQDKASKRLTFVNLKSGRISEKKSTPDRMNFEDISKELENPS